MITADRVVIVPTAPDESWGNFAWPPKLSADDVDYGIDLYAWLAGNGLTLSYVDLSASEELNVRSVTYPTDSAGAKIGVVMEINGGAAGATESVLARCVFVGGHSLSILVRLPILSLPADLVQVISDTTNVLTIGGQLVEIGAGLVPFGPAVTPPPDAYQLTIGGQTVTIGGQTLFG